MGGGPLNGESHGPGEKRRIQHLTQFPAKIDSPPAKMEWDGLLSLSGTIKNALKKL